MRRSLSKLIKGSQMLEVTLGGMTLPVGPSRTQTASVGQVTISNTLETSPTSANLQGVWKVTSWRLFRLAQSLTFLIPLYATRTAYVSATVWMMDMVGQMNVQRCKKVGETTDVPRANVGDQGSQKSGHREMAQAQSRSVKTAAFVGNGSGRAKQRRFSDSCLRG